MKRTCRPSLHPYRMKLLDMGISSREMCGILRREYGENVAECEISSYYSGTNRTPKAERVLGFIADYIRKHEGD